MPHDSWYPGFMTEFHRLSAAQRQAFLDTVQVLVAYFNAGKFPPTALFHKMSGYNVYECRWDPSGRFRATCEVSTEADGTIHVKWRHIGDHSIYKDPWLLTLLYTKGASR